MQAEQYQFKRGYRKISDNEAAAIRELEKFNNLAYFPLGIKIEINRDELLEYFDKEKQDIVTFHTSGLWKGIKPVSGPHVSDSSFRIDKKFNQIFPDFLPQVRDLLPVQDIHMLQMWEQNKNIGDHQDGGAADLNYFFPCSYRIVLVGESERSFYIKPIHGDNILPYIKNQERQIPLFNERPSYIQLPPGTNAFCFNNSACVHGATMPTNRKIIAFIDADLDFSKHLKLIRKSLSKFAEYVIYK